MTKQIYPENKSSINNSLEKAVKIYINKALLHFNFLLGCLVSLFLLLCSLSAIAQTNQSADNSGWSGHYYFSETAPATKRRNSEDVIPSASYEITVEERDDKLTASFSANGVQLFEAYECSVIIKNNTLEFNFQNLGSSEVQNFRKFKKGDLLFRLTKTGNAKTAKYLFEPAAYKIVRINQGKQKIPIYFEKPKT